MVKDKRVLLCVDDENIVLSVLKETLLYEFSNDYIIETAESAREGLEVIDDMTKAGYTIMVIISDWLMPGMKGDDFLIEAHKQIPDTVKILLSGQINDEAIQRAKKQANLHDYLSKPWNREKLIESIQNGIDNYPKK